MVYTIHHDWHDMKLKIDLELVRIASENRFSFNRVFDCTWLATVGKMCPKCTKTNNFSGVIINSNLTSQPLLIRKRKPIDFTLEEIEENNKDDSDFEAHIDISSVTSRRSAQRKCVKKNSMPIKSFFNPGHKL